MANIPGGKGSALRPASVSKETFDSNWDKIFSKERNNQPVEEDNKQTQYLSDDRANYDRPGLGG